MKTRVLITATVLLAIQVLSLQAFATMHYTCDFTLKSGETIRSFSSSGNDFLEAQSSVEGTDIFNDVRMVENAKTVRFLLEDFELLSINKGAEGENVEGRLNHGIEGEVTGICTSFEDIGP